MSSKVSENEILEVLHKLDPDSWGKVLDFMNHIQRQGVTTSAASIQTGHEILRSGLVGLWSDRDDIEDNLMFARQLRLQAEHRFGSQNVT